MMKSKTIATALIVLFGLLKTAPLAEARVLFLPDSLEGFVPHLLSQTYLNNSHALMTLGQLDSASPQSRDRNKAKSAPKSKELLVTATAYSSTPDQTDDDPFITASGAHVREGIIAANFLPFGTKVKIPELYGNKIFTVEDRMNKRYPFRIDIWFPNRRNVDDFGVKSVKIEIADL